MEDNVSLLAAPSAASGSGTDAVTATHGHPLPHGLQVGSYQDSACIARTLFAVQLCMWWPLPTFQDAILSRKLP